MHRPTQTRTKPSFFMSISRSGMGLALFGMIVLTTTTGKAEDPKRVATRVDNNRTHKLMPALKLARSSQASMRKVNDYEALFSKKELVGKKMINQKMQVKMREAPFSFYMMYVAGNAGREVIYVDGKNKNMLLFHGTGLQALAGTLHLSLKRKEVMSENRYPVTDFGMAKMLDKLVKQWEGELAYQDLVVKYYSSARIGDRACKAIEVSHPKYRKHFRFQMTRLFLDNETNLPVRLEQYAFPKNSRSKPELVEEYTYSRVRANVGLKDIDFSVKNPAYGF